MTIFENFTNKYSLPKTLRFELKPIGKTLQRIQEKGLIGQDEQRSEDYKEAKKIIDEYHKWFIEKVLKTVNIDESKLEHFSNAYHEVIKNKKNESAKKKLSDEQKSITKIIHKHIT